MRLKTLTKIFFKKHPYSATTPYNLGWLKKLPAAASNLLKANPIRIFDIGARNLSLTELEGLETYVDYVGFDADEEECEKLNSTKSRFLRQRIFPYYVSEFPGQVDFHLIERRGCSSRFLPASRFSELFAEDAQVRIDKTISLKGTPLREIVRLNGLEVPDLIKLDTQGSELEILRSFESELNDVPLVECEVEFVEQYEGQPLYHDVAKWMYDRGYELLYLNRVFKQRSKIYSGSAKGQIIFGDALFCKKESELSGYSNSKLERLVVILWCYGHIDIAYHIYKELLLPSGAKPELECLFEKIRYGSLRNKARQFAIGKIDTLVMCWLALRKTNGLRTEQDRCWPIR